MTAWIAAGRRRRGRAASRITGRLALATCTSIVMLPSIGVSQESGDSAIAMPRLSYPAGPLHRLLLGSNHRDLWSLPIRVEILDLDAFAGGLTPTRLGGGQQTLSLRLDGANGIEYAFRVIDKDASRTLDPALRQSIAARVLQDQVSALLPAASLVVSRLLDAAGVLHAEPHLVVMPDNPRLGEFREQFAGLLGTIEERPDDGPDGTPGFAGARWVENSEDFLDRIEDDPINRLDQAAYIRARLVDAFVGDWDRHPDQWNWAGFEEGGIRRWEPVPRDRDWALARLEGVLVWMAGFAFPNYVGFDREFPSAFRLSWTARALDRRLLAEAPIELWDSIAADIAVRIDDATIDEAVERLPAGYYDRIGATLAAALRSRRDDLPRFAREMYALLAGWVDVHATDVDEIATIDRLDGGLTRVTITRRSGDTSAGNPIFDRIFDPEETHEVRVYMHGGDDRVTVRGPGGPITIRVIGGGSDDTLVDESSGGRVHFYDDRGDNTIVPAGGTRVDRSDYEPPEATSDTQQAPPRDWGAFWMPVPYVAFSPELGLYLGMGAIRYGYGFRYAPWKTRLSFSAGYGTGAGGFRGHVDYDFPLYGALRARFMTQYTDADRDYFYGFGNQTQADSATDFYRADRRDFAVSLAATWRPVSSLEVSAGPSLRSTRPFRQESTLVARLEPYGAGDFSELGFLAGMVRDTRNHRTAASSGSILRIDARFFPAWLDADGSFGGARIEGATYLAADTTSNLVLALRAAGEKLWGRIPYHEAASLGGSDNLRGYESRRFTGDASVFGNAELRLRLGEAFLTLPVHFGVFGVADAGRVFVTGESSDRWHGAAGGGIWLAALHPANVITAAVVRGAARTGVYVKAGFAF